MDEELEKERNNEATIPENTQKQEAATISKVETAEETAETEMIEEIITGIHPSWNDLYKALYVYIELERRLESTDSATVSRLYKTILDRLEIPNRIINGINEYSWNEVEVDGQYYPVDLTADVEYFHSPASEGQIGVCNFAVNKEFYNNPKHATKEVSKSQKVTPNALPPERINEALAAIAVQYTMARVTERPTIRLQSKELSGLFEGGELSRETVGDRRELSITLTDSNVEETKSDLIQIATYYPELLSKVELQNSGTGRETVQEVLDEVCLARQVALTSRVASKTFEVVISGDNPNDFDLDFSRMQDAIIPGTTVDETTRGAKLTLRNTASGSFMLPDISSRLGGVQTLSISGLDIANLNLTGTNVRRLEAEGPRTINISRARGIDRLSEITLDGVLQAELDNYLNGPYRTSNNLFDVEIMNINLAGRPILQELRRGNRNVSNVTIRYASLDNLDGLEEFQDELYTLDISNNNIKLADLERLQSFYKTYYEPTRMPFLLFVYRNGLLENEARAIGGVSSETLEFVRSRACLENTGMSFYVQDATRKSRSWKNCRIS